MKSLDGVNGIVSYGQQCQQCLQCHNSRNPSISYLTHGERIGLILVAEARFLVTFIIIIIITFIIFIWIGWNLHRNHEKSPNGKWKLFKRPVDIYMLFLFVFEFLQIIGGILNTRCARNGIVTAGPYCTARGLIEQIGEFGVALSTLLLIVHTFPAAVWPLRLKARGVALSLVCLACVFIILWVAISPRNHENYYETPTPFWSRGGPYPGERLGAEYIWLWTALFASAILYIPLYFWCS